MALHRIDEHVFPETEALRRLLPLLMGRVFHISRSEYLESIQRTGQISTNEHGQLASTFGASRNSYFKNRGCVSVFDYRNPPEDKFEQFMGRCSPTAALTPECPIIVFFLSEATFTKLLPWTGWKIDGHPSEMILPYLEAGYPGPIPLDKIDEVIRVTATEEPNSLVSVMKRARNNAR